MPLKSMHWKTTLAAAMVALLTMPTVHGQVMCPSVSNLDTTTNCDTGQALVSWTNPILYDSFQVRAIDPMTLMVVAQVILPVTPGMAQPTSVALDLPPGNFGVQVVSTCPAGTTSMTAVPHNHLAGLVDRTNVVLEVASAGMIDSAGGWMSFFTLSTKNFIRADGFDEICAEQLGPGDVVWVCCGTFPNNYALTQSDGQLLADLILAGVGVYIEGADIWGFDNLTPFANYDGVAGRLGDGNVVPDGDDSCAQITGLAHATLDLTGWTEAYDGDSTSDDSTDRLFPTGTGPFATDLLGDNAGPVIRKTNGPPDSHYDVAIYYRTEFPFVPGVPGEPGKVLNNSIELGQSDDSTKTEVMLHFKTGFAPFIRGDCSGDGTCNLADVIVLLQHLFLGTEEPLCLDACDANDNGGLDIGDAFYKLQFLFAAGAAPPAPAPSDGCGLDPTLDGLDCLTTAGC